jgi:peptide/nickel transport system permease protein
MGLSLLFYSMPDFWLAMMLLIVFSTALGWFPSGGYSTPNADLTGIDHIVDVANHMVLPVITLVIAYVGEYYLVMRSSLLDVMGEDYITTVRAKGIREGRVLWGHAVRNAMLPTISVIALSIGYIIGGAIVVEVVFSYPGLGLLTFQALDAQDFLLLQGLFLFFTLAVLVSNLVADLLYSYFDPRVREA